MGAWKDKDLGGCCDGLKLVLSRRRESDRLGLMLERMYGLKTGFTRERIVVRINKDKDRKAEFANTTFVLVNYCPFCGKHIGDDK